MADINRRWRDGAPAPLALGQEQAAQARLIVWCKSCARRTEPDVGELVADRGATMTVIDWAARLVCTNCGARDADFVVTGSRR